MHALAAKRWGQGEENLSAKAEDDPQVDFKKRTQEHSLQSLQR